MKNLMLNYEYPPIGGGAANATWYILKEMSEMKNVEIDLITSSPSDEFQLETMGDNIEVHKLPVGKSELHYWTQLEVLRYCWNAYKYIKKMKEKRDYDLCHAFFGIPCGAIAQRFKNDFPYIVSLRGSDIPGFNPRFSIQYIFLKPIIKRVWKDASIIVANSRGLKELALKTSPNESIDVIPNGVDTDRFRPPESKRDDGNTRILCVARLIERKGIDHLIKAMPKVIKECGNVELVLVGEGKLEQDLKDLSRKLKISDKVIFRGRVPHDQMAEVYRSSDIFVLPSKSEGMSNAILEAMASGLPIVTTDTGGVEELIDENGKIIPLDPSENISDLIYQAVVEIIKNNKIGEMGASSRRIAESFSWECVAERYYEMYESLT